MSKLLNIKEIIKMLDATMMSHEEKVDFLSRLKRTKEWTPELAEEFGQAILSSLRTYEADLAVYTATVEAKQNEIVQLEQKWNEEYETLAKQGYSDFTKLKSQTEKAITVANQQIDKYVLKSNAADLGTMLQDIYK